jgi:hypothetical protein
MPSDGVSQRRLVVISHSEGGCEREPHGAHSGLPLGLHLGATPADPGVQKGLILRGFLEAALRWRRGRDCRAAFRNSTKSGTCCSPEDSVCTNPVSQSRLDFRCTHRTKMQNRCDDLMTLSLYQFEAVSSVCPSVRLTIHPSTDPSPLRYSTRPLELIPSALCAENHFGQHGSR